jgi:hypothetical protein
MSQAEYDEAIARGEHLNEDAVVLVEPLGDPLLGHDDGLAEDGVRRLRRPPDWSQSIDASGVETTVVILPAVAPAIGAVDVDGLRYRVLDVTPRRDIPDPIGLGARAFDLDLDQVGPSPHDPLVPRAREIIERHGATVERLSATREGSWHHASIHAVASWPDRTIDVYGSGPNDHAALDDLDEHLDYFTP